MNKKSTLISIILLILVLGGVYLINKLSYKPTPAIENVSTASDWKIYKNIEYGFEIKYPPTWAMSESPTLDPETNKIFCPPELTDKSGECMRKETFGHMPDTLAPILFRQRPGNELNSNNSKYRVLGTRNSFKYELILVNSSYSKEYELIASSFRFIIATTSKVVTTSKSATTSKVASVKLISPNGGEEFIIGQTYYVFGKGNLNGGVDAKLRLSLVSKIDKNERSISGCNSSNYFKWTIPDTVLPGQYKLIARTCDSWAGGGSEMDESDNYFTILPSDSKKQIAVLSPNGGEEWVDKSIHQIIWSNNSTTTNLVDLYLWDDLKCGPYGGNLPVYPTCPQAYITLDKNIDTNSIYNWIVGTDIKNNNIIPGRYKVAVCKAGNFDCDFSNTEFSITSK